MGEIEGLVGDSSFSSGNDGVVRVHVVSYEEGAIGVNHLEP